MHVWRNLFLFLGLYESFTAYAIGKAWAPLGGERALAPLLVLNLLRVSYLILSFVWLRPLHAIGLLIGVFVLKILYAVFVLPKSQMLRMRPDRGLRAAGVALVCLVLAVLA